MIRDIDISAQVRKPRERELLAYLRRYRGAFRDVSGKTFIGKTKPDAAFGSVKAICESEYSMSKEIVW